MCTRGRWGGEGCGTDSKRGTGGSVRKRYPWVMEQRTKADAGRGGEAQAVHMPCPACYTRRPAFYTRRPAFPWFGSVRATGRTGKM